jgi:hypothetical protein
VGSAVADSADSLAAVVEAVALVAAVKEAKGLVGAVGWVAGGAADLAVVGEEAEMGAEVAAVDNRCCGTGCLRRTQSACSLWRRQNY